MTTKVTVDAHAGWPVNVQLQNRKDAKSTEWTTVETQVVPAMGTADIYVHQTRRLIVEEGERS